MPTWHSWLIILYKRRFILLLLFCCVSEGGQYAESANDALKMNGAAGRLNAASSLLFSQ